MDLRNRAVSPYRGQENARKKGQSEMALRLEPFGIHVIIIEPGYFRTDSLDSSSVPLRRHRQYGVNNSPENLHKGFTHVYLITFENADARDAYLPHPEHKKFGELLGK
jgi:NAD(P)-dependent dehydrogenase (short-subunit alcohol dehydrogenase family)